MIIDVDLQAPHLQAVLSTHQGGPQTGIFTDGSSIPNPGPGGWGFVYVEDGQIQTAQCGSDKDTTNNRMELSAILYALKSIPEDSTVEIFSDSNLCVQTFNTWAHGWAKRGWKRKAGPIANLDLVKPVYEEFIKRPKIKLTWIKAHNGGLWNEYADALSTMWMNG